MNEKSVINDDQIASNRFLLKIITFENDKFSFVFFLSIFVCAERDMRLYRNLKEEKKINIKTQNRLL